MKYCPKCGAEVAEDATFCPACGNELNQPQQQPQPQQQQPQQQPTARRNWADSLATVGMILGIISFVLGLLALIPLIGAVIGTLAMTIAVPGLALSIVGSIKATSKKKATTGIVFNILAIVFSFVGFIILGVFAALATEAAA